jgi:hypothetical protein
MLRRNFLRNAALTLPVAMVAPNALLAETGNAPHTTDLIFIGNGGNLPHLLPASTLALDSASSIVCNGKGFLLTDRQGKRYHTAKIVFANTFSFCDTKARLHVQTSGTQTTTLSIKKDDRHSVRCWISPSGTQAEQVLPAFMGSNKAAILCLQ